MGDTWLHLEFLFTRPGNSFYTADRSLTNIPVSEREADLKSYLIFRFLFLEFENTILQVTANNSYSPYLMCLINATETEDSKLTGNHDFINIVGPQLEYVVPVFSKCFL